MRLIFTLLATFFISYLSAQYTLTILVDDINKIVGEMSVTLYNPHDGYPYEGILDSTTQDIQARRFTITFEGLEEGDYSVVIFQDENMDGLFNMNFFRIPVECFGFSNINRLIMKEPTFDRTKFYLDQDTVVSVKLLSIF